MGGHLRDVVMPGCACWGRNLTEWKENWHTLYCLYYALLLSLHWAGIPLCLAQVRRSHPPLLFEFYHPVASIIQISKVNSESGPVSEIQLAGFWRTLWFHPSSVNKNLNLKYSHSSQSTSCTGRYMFAFRDIKKKEKCFCMLLYHQL